MLTEAAAWARARTGVAMWPVPFPVEAVRPSVEGGSVVLALRADRIVGAFALTFEDLRVWGSQPPDAGYVHRVVVRRELARQGLGALLLEEAEGRARREGKTKLRLDTVAANQRLRAYYRGLGYREVGRARAGPPGEELDLVLFERAL